MSGGYRVEVDMAPPQMPRGERRMSGGYREPESGTEPGNP